MRKVTKVVQPAKTRGRPKKLPITIDRATTITQKEMHKLVYAATSGKSVHDVINHPAHYTDGGIEVIDFIEAKRLGYHLGNVIKYICRAGKKGTIMGLQDLEKARWYLDRAIEKNETNPSTR